MSHPKPRKRILVVDDSPLSLAVEKETLESAGFSVVCARDLSDIDRMGESEIDALDLVLMDVKMPEAYGDDVAMVLRSVRGVKSPILLVSSLDDAELERRVADAGVDGYISKHGGLDELARRVRTILGDS
jgi:two-component system sensor histidine kinase and response regulator WspE